MNLAWVTKEAIHWWIWHGWQQKLFFLIHWLRVFISGREHSKENSYYGNSFVDLVGRNRRVLEYSKEELVEFLPCNTLYGISADFISKELQDVPLFIWEIGCSSTVVWVDFAVWTWFCFSYCYFLAFLSFSLFRQGENRKVHQPNLVFI